MPTDLVAYALSYPFAIPERSYVVAGDGHQEFAADAPEPDLDEMLWTLAIAFVV